jgi:hypothetical protein
MVPKLDDCEIVRRLIAKQEAHDALDAVMTAAEKGLRPPEPPIKRRRD